MNLIAALMALFAFLVASQYPKRDWPLNTALAKDVAVGITDVTTEPWEVETLGKIAYYESGGIRRAVANCTIIGKIGERGVFQVLPRNMTEQLDLCSSDISKQARVALGRIRESKQVCERQGIRGADVLGIYTHGRCVRGNREAAFRYGDGSKLRSLIKE
jgi:hypothetical protein